MKGYPVIPRTVVISLCSLQNISLYAQLAKPRFQLRSQWLVELFAVDTAAIKSQAVINYTTSSERADRELVTGLRME